MENSEQVAYQEMLRDCENRLFGGDVQDDTETTHTWYDAKKELPPANEMCWVAVPCVVLCTHKTFLLYLDSDGRWRDNSGVFFGRTVNFWKYADVPECNIPC